MEGSMKTRNVALRPVNQEEMDVIRSKLLKDLNVSEEILAVCQTENVRTVGDLHDLSAQSLVATNFSCIQVNQLRKLMTALGLKRRSPAELSLKQQAELNQLVGRELRWLSTNVVRDARDYAGENQRYTGYLLSRNPVDRALARHMLVAINEPGVRSIAYRYASFITGNSRTRSYSIDLEDLLAEGNLGVLRAAEEFDPRTGNQFYTYAVWWIRHHIRRYLFDGGVICVPVNLQQRVQKYNRLRKTLPAAVSHTELSAFMCRELNMASEKFEEFLKIREELELLYPERLDSTTADDSGIRDMYERAQVEGAYDMDEVALSSWLQRDIAVSLEEASDFVIATPRDKQIMRMLYGLDGNEPMTLQAVGDIFGVTRERIRQVEARMLERLRHPRLWVGKEDQLEELLGRYPVSRSPLRR